MMEAYSMTLKFTLQELQDNISRDSCGDRGQSRKFNFLVDENLKWTGQTYSLKAPVILLEAFSDAIQIDLVKGKHYRSITLIVFSNTVRRKR